MSSPSRRAPATGCCCARMASTASSTTTASAAGLTSPSCRQAAEQLVQWADDAGGRDNATAMVLELGRRGGRAVTLAARAPSGPGTGFVARGPTAVLFTSDAVLVDAFAGSAPGGEVQAVASTTVAAGFDVGRFVVVTWEPRRAGDGVRRRRRRDGPAVAADALGRRVADVGGAHARRHRDRHHRGRRGRRRQRPPISSPAWRWRAGSGWSSSRKAPCHRSWPR